MGLFGNREADSLRSLLDAMHGSTLRDIDAILAGNPPQPPDFMPEMALNSRIDKAAGLTTKLCQKGKRGDAEAILAEWAAKPVPRLMLFRANEVGGFDAAAAEAAAELRTSRPRSGAGSEGSSVARRGRRDQVTERPRRRLCRLNADDSSVRCSRPARLRSVAKRKLAATLAPCCGVGSSRFELTRYGHTV